MNNNSTAGRNERQTELKRAALITLIINILLSVAKLVIGLISGSTAVISDAVHSFSDVFTTVLVMAGITISSGEADKEHPYGHYRVESVISLVMAFILGVLAVFLGYEGIVKIMDGAETNPTIPALLVTISSIAIKEWMFQYTKRKAKRYSSMSLMADAWHHRSDAISSIAVLIGVVGGFFGVGLLDSVATLAVCLILLKVAFDLGKTAVNQLVDSSADQETVETIRGLALSVDGVKGIDLLKTRVSNNVVFVELEITVDQDLTVCEGHDIAETVHAKVESAGLLVEHCMVHVNPMEEMGY